MTQTKKNSGDNILLIKSKKNLLSYLSNKNYWAVYFLVVVAICVAGIGYFIHVSHYEIPPLCDFVDTTGKVVISEENINHGERVFHLRGLMSYGSFLGDGAERGPDFTAEALHKVGLATIEFYEKELIDPSEHDKEAVEARVRKEFRKNTYDAEKNHVVLTPARIAAWEKLFQYYDQVFSNRSARGFQYIKDQNDIRDLASFFFWGAWLSTASRPGERYSYTHNWPHDPQFGNVPTAATILWSACAMLVLFVGFMITLFIWGQLSYENQQDDGTKGSPLTTQDLENGIVRDTQPECYKFFILSMIAFVIQVCAGVACSIDVVAPVGMSLTDYIPYTVLRSYHTTFQIYWFFVAWVGTTIWFLPRFQKDNCTPYGQKFLIEVLYGGCLVVAVGGVFGIPLGQMGYLDEGMAYLYGSQGWEFMELGRVFQNCLLAAFVLWILILYRGIQEYLTWDTMWSTPAWVFYGSLVMVWFLFFSLKINPKANFIVNDFWRWMVVHMWVEVTFEVFTTVIIAFLYRELGLITKRQGERATYIAVMLFFLTAVIGVGHNFYWIAKPTGVIALGSAFSTTQVLPLILLTMDAWKFIQMKQQAVEFQNEGSQKHVMKGVFMFVLGVNFWNVVGAGVLGSFVNLPIVNYFMHATYLTGNHAHAAMWGVKGNIAIAGMLFSAQHLIEKKYWSDRLIQITFWSLNGGIALQMITCMFPIGFYHMFTCMTTGLWAARDHTFFKSFLGSWLYKSRAIGGHLFLWGGLFPLVYFVLSRYFYLKKVTKVKNADKKNESFWLDAEHTAPYGSVATLKKNK